MERLEFREYLLLYYLMESVVVELAETRHIKGWLVLAQPHQILTKFTGLNIAFLKCEKGAW
jgi:hypothetical protein